MNYTNQQIKEYAELLTFKRLITEVYPNGLVSVVSDTFDYWLAIGKFASKLYKEIMNRNGKVVFRPDTGDPVKIVCGYNLVFNLEDLKYKENARYATYVRHTNGKEGYCEVIFDENQKPIYGKEITELEVKGSIQVLWDTFGGTISPQGYKILDSHVGLIYGDSITLERAELICEGLKEKGFASINTVLGVGSYSYQYATRDTDGYAVKATYVEIEGKSISIFKDPKTDDGTKKSAKGLLAVFKDENGELYLKDEATWEEVRNCEFVKVFEDGKLLVDDSLSEIRKRLENS